jgi:hypothetical protein
MALVVYAQQTPGRARRTPWQRHVSEEIVVVAELDFLLRRGLAAGAVCRSAAMEGIALPYQHLRVIARRHLMPVGPAGVDLGEGERRRSVGGASLAERHAAEKPEGPARDHAFERAAARQAQLNQLGDVDGFNSP